MTPDDIRKIKAAMFSERDTAQEVLDWTLAAVSHNDHTPATVAIMMMWNTCCELIAKEMENPPVDAPPMSGSEAEVP